MPTLNVKLYGIARDKPKLTEADAKEFALTIEEEVQNSIKKSEQEYNSFVHEDILKLEMTLSGEIKDSMLDVCKTIFITGVCN